MASREGYLAKLLADSLGVPIADVDRVLQEDATGNVAKFFEADGPSKIVFSNEGEVRPAVAAPHGQRGGGRGGGGSQEGLAAAVITGAFFKPRHTDAVANSF